MLSHAQLDVLGRLRTFPPRHQLCGGGDAARYFYQVESGVVRLLTYGEHQTLVHQLVFPGETFGETVVYSGALMPYTVEALTEVAVWQVDPAALLELLRADPALHWEFTRHLGALLQHYRQRNANQALLPAAGQIIWLVDYYVRHVQQRRHTVHTAAQRCEICDRTTPQNDGYFCVPFTRQQIADMLGLRVETVVRSVKELARTGRLRLLHHKMLYHMPLTAPLTS